MAKPQRQTYPPCETCGKTNQPAEKCWQGAVAHLRPKRTRPHDKANDAKGTSKKRIMLNNHLKLIKLKKA